MPSCVASSPAVLADREIRAAQSRTDVDAALRAALISATTPRPAPLIELSSSSTVPIVLVSSVTDVPPLVMISPACGVEHFAASRRR